MIRLLALNLILLLAAPAVADIVTGRAYITDGDTIRIGDTRVRLFGLDAPERAQQCERDGSATAAETKLHAP